MRRHSFLLFDFPFVVRQIHFFTFKVLFIQLYQLLLKLHRFFNYFNLLFKEFYMRRNLAAHPFAVFAEDVARSDVVSPASLCDTLGHRLWSGQRCEDAIVRIVGPEATCTGTLIDDDLILTAHHCVVERDAQGYIYSGGNFLKERRRPIGWTPDRDPFMLETSVPGIFVAGDVRHASTKGVTSGVGEGAMAVKLIHQYLSTV